MHKFCHNRSNPIELFLQVRYRSAHLRYGKLPEYGICTYLRNYTENYLLQRSRFTRHIIRYYGWIHAFVFTYTTRTVRFFFFLYSINVLLFFNPLGSTFQLPSYRSAHLTRDAGRPLTRDKDVYSTQRMRACVPYILRYAATIDNVCAALDVPVRHFFPAQHPLTHSQPTTNIYNNNISAFIFVQILFLSNSI